MVRRREEKRVDRKHRFPLRIDETVHSEIDALSFKHNVSQNIVYVEAVKYAMRSPGFHPHMQTKFPRDTRRGHFVYIQDEQTRRIGREV